ncbi:unnamed protein product [Closterium sp. NIES-64]|nr:unnamed protein product [Closterium sp. NIES-64]
MLSQWLKPGLPVLLALAALTATAALEATRATHFSSPSPPSSLLTKLKSIACHHHRHHHHRHHHHPHPHPHPHHQPSHHPPPLCQRTTLNSSSIPATTSHPSPHIKSPQKRHHHHPSHHPSQHPPPLYQRGWGREGWVGAGKAGERTKMSMDLEVAEAAAHIVNALRGLGEGRMGGCREGRRKNKDEYGP